MNGPAMLGALLAFLVDGVVIGAILMVPLTWLRKRQGWPVMALISFGIVGIAQVAVNSMQLLPLGPSFLMLNTLVSGFVVLGIVYLWGKWRESAAKNVAEQRPELAK